MTTFNNLLKEHASAKKLWCDLAEKEEEETLLQYLRENYQTNVMELSSDDAIALLTKKDPLPALKEVLLDRLKEAFSDPIDEEMQVACNYKGWHPSEENLNLKIELFPNYAADWDEQEKQVNHG